MKFTKLTIAILSAATVFVSCNDDDDITEGRFDRAELYATSNTSSNITVYDFSDGDNPETSTLTVSGSSDNEGIFYDESNDQLIFGSRTANAVAIATGIEDLIDGTATSITPTYSSNDLSSVRSIAVSGNTIVAANNVTNELYVYQRTGNSVTLRNTVNVDFALWEIQFVDNALYAVVDMTSDLAVFNNFLSNTADATVQPSKRITIAGINRTHGMVYNSNDDIMILTDIGAANNDSGNTPDFASDGAFHIISGFTNKFAGVANGGTLAVAGNQVRVSGNQTLLGNPISATYDSETDTIFIAERANNGGRILGFDASANGNATPIINNALAGASSVFFYGED